MEKNISQREIEIIFFLFVEGFTFVMGDLIQLFKKYLWAFHFFFQRENLSKTRFNLYKEKYLTNKYT